MQKEPGSFSGLKGTDLDLIIARVFDATMQDIASLGFCYLIYGQLLKCSVGFSPCKMRINFCGWKKKKQKKRKKKQTENYSRQRTPAGKKFFSGYQACFYIILPPASRISDSRVFRSLSQWCTSSLTGYTMKHEKERALGHAVGTNIVHSPNCCHAKNQQFCLIF